MRVEPKTQVGILHFVQAQTLFSHCPLKGFEPDAPANWERVNARPSLGLSKALEERIYLSLAEGFSPKDTRYARGWANDKR